MSGTPTYEIEVKVRNNGSSMTKMFHISARTPKQAANRVKKFGRVLSVQKVHADEMLSSIDRLVLNDAHYTKPLETDSMAALEIGVFKPKITKKT